MKQNNISTLKWQKIVTGLIVFVGLVASIVQLIEYFSEHKSSIPNLIHEDTLAKLRRGKKLKVGYIPYYDISSREAKSGLVKGFLVDVLYKIADDLNISDENIEFLETDWQNFGAGLNSGKYDLSIAGTFRTPEREQIASFTDPIFYLGNGALVRKGDGRFSSIDDFNREDVIIAVVLGEQGYEYAKNNLKKAKLKIMPGPDLSLACLEVEKGLVDAALSDQYILKLYISKHPTVKDALAENPYLVLPICWAVRKDDVNWLKYLNDQIVTLNESGWLRRLSAEYHTIPWAKPTGMSPSPLAATETSLIRKYFGAFATGILYTILISSASIILGTLLGAILALMIATSSNSGGMKFLRIFVNAYVYSFLAIPALVLIIIFYYNNYISNLNSVAASIIALGLNLSPFAAKIIASGITNIHIKYLHAAKAFGYKDGQIALKFKLPLVIRNSMQPLLVQWYTTIKLSSLASVIGVTEVLHRSQQVIRETYQTEEAYLILVACYMVIVIPLALVADYFKKITKSGSGV